jgi:hypothetical protein
MRRTASDGSALIGCIFLILVLSTLGTVSLNVASHEIEAVQAARAELIADNLATSGIEVVLASFHHGRVTKDPAVATLFTKRFDLPQSGPSFFDANGRSQFTGTADHPDLLLDASRPDDNQLLNHPEKGWFRSLGALGRVLRLKVYGPVRPGLLCTVEVTASAGGISRTSTVQLGARTIPALRAGVQLRTGPTSASVGELPIQALVHWGDLKVGGDANLGKRNEIPIKTSLAPVGEQPYADMVKAEDRWVDVWVGGQALLTVTGGELPSLPENVHVNREPSPGLALDHWDYETMKRQALLYGSYYVPDENGLLYRNGIMESGQGLTPTDVLASTNVGDHLGLVFIDTLDQRTPSGHNLSHLLLEAEYSEGLFIVNAHLHWKPKGAGLSVPALSPPPEDSSSLAARVPARLSGIHLQGVLYVVGQLSYAGAPRIYGGLVTEGDIAIAPANPPSLEVWYNYDLRAGQIRGIPVVYLVPGTWQERY